MFLAYSPPQMLPTVTMNPTATATAGASTTAKAKKRSMEDFLTLPLNKDAAHIKREGDMPEGLIHRIDMKILWWSGIGMTIFGAAAYML